MGSGFFLDFFQMQEKRKLKKTARFTCPSSQGRRPHGTGIRRQQGRAQRCRGQGRYRRAGPCNFLRTVRVSSPVVFLTRWKKGSVTWQKKQVPATTIRIMGSGLISCTSAVAPSTCAETTAVTIREPCAVARITAMMKRDQDIRQDRDERGEAHFWQARILP